MQTPSYGLRLLFGFALAPLVAVAFTLAMMALHEGRASAAAFASLLSIAYPAAVLCGLPIYWLLRKRELEELPHWCAAGSLVGLAPAVLLYAITVDPVLALATTAGGAVGGMTFWWLSVRGVRARSHS